MLEQVGRYRIVGEIGRGAMGVVYRAADPSIGRSVAIKTIRMRDIDDTQQREKLRERLFREARSAGVLSHPNIVTIYDMDEEDGVAYIAMAFVNGPTLEKILSSAEPLSGARMLRILRQAALGLDYAHGKGIIHRDVKPANVMTDEDGSVKITDFGIARMAVALHSHHNDTKTIAGTPNYMSPEQVRGADLDGRSDQFSLAVIAYEILTGERPFQGEHLSTVVYRIVTEEPQPAHRLNGTLTQQIDDVLRKALSKNPEERFPNCSNFVGALELACAESRGWKTLAAGTSAEMPTIAVERVAENGNDYEPGVVTAPQRPSRALPVVMSILVVSGLAAIFMYESGLTGRTPPVHTAQSPPPQPIPQPEEPVPVEEASGHSEPAPAATSSVPAGPNLSAPHLSVPQSAVSPLLSQDISIATNPSGARAVLDGSPDFSCVTPCQLRAAAGSHRLAVSLAGYASEVREIHVEDTAVEALITLRQPTGTLMLATNPAGASIRINGELIPRVTPAELPLRPGSYSVTVEKDGAVRTERIQLRESPLYLRIPLGR